MDHLRVDWGVMGVTVAIILVAALIIGWTIKEAIKTFRNKKQKLQKY
ncbi:hypothetical protein [Terribacillus saccharophilus]|nr:hypothetical protein [Terribacillus saccharophilus]